MQKIKISFNNLVKAQFFENISLYLKKKFLVNDMRDYLKVKTNC